MLYQLAQEAFNIFASGIQVAAVAQTHPIEEPGISQELVCSVMSTEEYKLALVMMKWLMQRKFAYK